MTTLLITNGVDRVLCDDFIDLWDDNCYYARNARNFDGSKSYQYFGLDWWIVKDVVGWWDC